LKLFTALLLSIVLLGACGGATEAPEPTEVAPAPAGTREAPYLGHGFIEQIDENQLLINHEDIAGFMPAMTMAFPITGEVDAESLEVGDEVDFSIELLDAGGYQVFSVEKVEE
jgi:Cu/Ag efflux protein CusF